MNARKEDPGFFFGGLEQYIWDQYVGLPQGADGHIMVVGGSGSGKSSGIVLPTLRTWQGAICATDPKGELSNFYAELYRQGQVTRPFLVFDPLQEDGPSFDPFWWLQQDDCKNLMSNVWDLAISIVQPQPDANDPFWVESEQGILAAALLHFFNLGLSFSEAVVAIVDAESLCEKLAESEDTRVRAFVGQALTKESRTYASIDRGLRNKLALFATDLQISHAFRGQREGANCFTWTDLGTHNIFVCIPADRIEEWGGAVNLMYAQLIRYLERRPEKYSSEGMNTVQTLLLMDEFARFGKLEMITAAMATLRSKGVTMCLVSQSMAQLDGIYGKDERRVILDNCDYLAILRANDPDTQRYLAERIGTCTEVQRSAGENLDGSLRTTGYSRHIAETREWRISPHELSMLADILLLSPHGFCRIEKFRAYQDDWIAPAVFRALRFIGDEAYCDKVADISSNSETFKNDFKRNKGAIMLTIDERAANAASRAAKVQHQQRVEAKAEHDAEKKKGSHRNYIIGALVSQYFPELLHIEPGSRAENEVRFAPLADFLSALATTPGLVENIQEIARRRRAIADISATAATESVSGQADECGAAGGVDCG